MLRRKRLACLAKQPGDHFVRTENDPNELHLNVTDRTKQRVGTRGEASLMPGQQAGRRGLRLRRLRLGLGEYGTCLDQVMLPPTRGKQTGVTHHLEVLVRDVTDQTAEEGEHRQRLIRGLAALRVVLEGEAH